MNSGSNNKQQFFWHGFLGDFHWPHARPMKRLLIRLRRINPCHPCPVTISSCPSWYIFIYPPRTLLTSLPLICHRLWELVCHQVSYKVVKTIIPHFLEFRYLLSDYLRDFPSFQIISGQDDMGIGPLQ